MDYKHKLTKEKDMFVEFDKVGLDGKILGSTWINPDSVFSVDVLRPAVFDETPVPEDLLYAPPKSVVKPGVISIRGGEFTTLVSGDVQSILHKLKG
jgi:hypothetical protein